MASTSERFSGLRVGQKLLLDDVGDHQGQPGALQDLPALGEVAHVAVDSIDAAGVGCGRALPAQRPICAPSARPEGLLCSNLYAFLRWHNADRERRASLDNPPSPAEVDMVNNLHHVDGRGCSANNDVRRLGIGNRLPGDDYGSLGLVICKRRR